MDIWGCFSEDLIDILNQIGFSESPKSQQSYFYIDEKKERKDEAVLGIIWNIQNSPNIKPYDKTNISRFNYSDLNLLLINLNKTVIQIELISKSKITDLKV